MKKPIVLVLSTLMLGMSATAMADSNHRWDNITVKTIIAMNSVMIIVMTTAMIIELLFGHTLSVETIMADM
jgi:hypothetical protein